MDKFLKIVAILIFVIGVSKILPKEKEGISGFKIAAAKDSSWDLLQEISDKMRLEKMEISESLMGDC